MQIRRFLELTIAFTPNSSLFGFRKVATSHLNDDAPPYKGFMVKAGEEHNTEYRELTNDVNQRFAEHDIKIAGTQLSEMATYRAYNRAF